ncbi:hypothetical protein K457DRAFT_22263 [Linnemannia elongata AG-77]|uniref:Crinkler effector protein N-terminal domain-containing protein n=1 Tax=Linnemannia elongata AG-77 TaxID=1314771 RepID=A0A197JMX4_9FUNG|nr:hypothetical protein K457DRAFT_22263 [Linnemannia elongata AG-77]
MENEPWRHNEPSQATSMKSAEWNRSMFAKSISYTIDKTWDPGIILEEATQQSTHTGVVLSDVIKALLKSTCNIVSAPDPSSTDSLAIPGLSGVEIEWIQGELNKSAGAYFDKFGIEAIKTSATLAEESAPYAEEAILHNAATANALLKSRRRLSNIDNRLNLFCLADEEGTLDAFPVEIESTQTISDLKKLIKSERLPALMMSLPMSSPSGVSPSLEYCKTETSSPVRSIGTH